MNLNLAAELVAMADADQAAARATIGPDGRYLPAGHMPLQQYLDLARDLPHPPASDVS